MKRYEYLVEGFDPSNLTISGVAKSITTWLNEKAQEGWRVINVQSFSVDGGNYSPHIKVLYTLEREI